MLFSSSACRIIFAQRYESSTSEMVRANVLGPYQNFMEKSQEGTVHQPVIAQNRKRNVFQNIDFIHAPCFRSGWWLPIPLHFICLKTRLMGP